MSTTPDAVALLDALTRGRPEDAFDPDAPAARAGLERILQTPPLGRAPRPPRRRRRRVALAATAAAVAAAALALLPSVGDSPDVVARAAAALNDPGTILHFQARVRSRDSRDELHAGAPDERVDHTVEVWQTAGARQERMVYDGTGEYVEDWDTKTALAYNAERDELIANTDPGYFDPAQRIARGSDDVLGRGNVTDDLARLLQRARDGDQSVHLLRETTIHATPVYELRVDYSVRTVILPKGESVTDPRGLPTKTVKLSHLVYVDRDSYLPVQIVDLGPGDIVSAVTDYVTAERLPRTPASEQLLRMSPHPGAEHVDGGAING